MRQNKLKKIPGLDPIDVKKKKIKKETNKIKKNKIRKERREKIKERYQSLNLTKIILIIASIFVFLLAAYKLVSTEITNIEVSGNTILSDQEIIDIAGLRNYPKTLSVSKRKIKKRLEENIYISSVKVKKSDVLKKVIIKVEENRPLFYYYSLDKTVLSDGNYTDDSFNVPILVNQVPEDILAKLTKAMSNLKDEIIIRINEIKYAPSDLDNELFIFSMTDGNLILVNNNTMNKLNEYLSMLKTFNNKKGILHLDSGDYFEIMTGKGDNNE